MADYELTKVYKGHTITIQVPKSVVDKKDTNYVKQAFEDYHQSRYPDEAGRVPPDLGGTSKGQITTPMEKKVSEMRPVKAPGEFETPEKHPEKAPIGAMQHLGNIAKAYINTTSPIDVQDAMQGKLSLNKGFMGGFGMQPDLMTPETISQGFQSPLPQDVDTAIGSTLPFLMGSAPQLSPRVNSAFSKGAAAARNVELSPVGAKVGTGIGATMGGLAAHAAKLPPYVGMTAGAGVGLGVGSLMAKVPPFLRGMSQAEGQWINPNIPGFGPSVIRPGSGPVVPPDAPIHPLQGLPEYDTGFTMPNRGGTQPPVQPQSPVQIPQRGSPVTQPPVMPPAELPSAGQQLQLPERSPIQMPAGHPTVQPPGVAINPPGVREIGPVAVQATPEAKIPVTPTVSVKPVVKPPIKVAAKPTIVPKVETKPVEVPAKAVEPAKTEPAKVTPKKPEPPMGPTTQPEKPLVTPREGLPAKAKEINPVALKSFIDKRPGGVTTGDIQGEWGLTEDQAVEQLAKLKDAGHIHNQSGHWKPGKAAVKSPEQLAAKKTKSPEDVEFEALDKKDKLSNLTDEEEQRWMELAAQRTKAKVSSAAAEVGKEKPVVKAPEEVKSTKSKVKSLKTMYERLKSVENPSEMQSKRLNELTDVIYKAGKELTDAEIESNLAKLEEIKKTTNARNTETQSKQPERVQEKPTEPKSSQTVKTPHEANLLVSHVEPSWKPGDVISRSHLVQLADAMGVKQGPAARALIKAGFEIEPSKFAGGYGIGRPTKSGINAAIDEELLTRSYRKLVMSGKIKAED